MALLRELELIPAAIRDDGRFIDAARVLLTAKTSAIAVVDGDHRVLGLFTDDDLLRGLFPHYLEDLHHTAFLVNEALQASAKEVASEPVSRHMRVPVTVEIDAAGAHVVERFLHTPWGAIAVVERGRFVGMVNQLEFVALLLQGLDLPVE
jgi:CBS domain-containing protein